MRHDEVPFDAQAIAVHLRDFDHGLRVTGMGGRHRDLAYCCEDAAATVPMTRAAGLGFGLGHHLGR